MYSNKLTHKQHKAICGFISGLRKLNIEPRKSFNLSELDESSYESTNITFNHAQWLCSSLQNFMNNVYNSRH